MLTFEIQPNDRKRLSDLMSIPGAKVYEVDSLDGNDFTQIVIPLVSIVIPLVTQLIQKYINDNRVTIKFDGVEVSALGYEKAMNLLNKVLEQRKLKDNESKSTKTI